MPEKSPSFAVAAREVEEAFADCHGTREAWNHGMNRRNLDFHASAEVTRAEAKEIMTAYVPGYNQFRPSLLDKLPADSRVLIAREFSVALYVKTNFPSAINAEEMLADECDVEENDGEYAAVVRLWWD